MYNVAQSDTNESSLNVMIHEYMETQSYPQHDQLMQYTVHYHFIYTRSTKYWYRVVQHKHFYIATLSLR